MLKDITLDGVSARAAVELGPDVVVNNLLRNAAAQQSSGRLAKAALTVEAALRLRPAHAEAMLRLGVIRAQQGELEAAIALLRRGLEGNPSSAEGHNNLGMTLHNLGREDEAIAAYRQALSLRSDYPIALNNLGAALAAIGRHDEAITNYEAALADNPTYVEALSNLGTALHAMKRTAEAVERFRAALSLRPDFIDAELNLGHALVALEQFSAAIVCYQAVLKIKPRDAAAHVFLADALRSAKRSREAAKHYQKACAISQDLAPAHIGLAHIDLEHGRIAEAQWHVERALTLDTLRPSYFYMLTRAKKFRPGDPHLTAMLTLAADLASLPKGEAIDLHFGLGKALTDVGRNDEAFRHFLAGNKLKREAVTYDETAMLRGTDRIRAVFNKQLVRSRTDQGDPSPSPIFIVGMPRSGSTLVEQILASHPNVFGVGEINAFHGAVRTAGLHVAARQYPGSACDYSAERLAAIGSGYLERLQAQARVDGARFPVARICDKMLDNFRYLGLIHLALPNARIIHTRRDPIDTCLSCFSIQFAKLTFTSDLGELGRRYHAYARLMEHWQEILPPGTILDVQYEHVVDNFEVEARRLVTFCGLDWDERCARFYETKRPVRTASLVQVRQPIYKNSVGRWRPSEEIMRPLVEALAGTHHDGVRRPAHDERTMAKQLKIPDDDIAAGDQTLRHTRFA